MNYKLFINKDQRKNGFTLVELLVSIAVFVVFLGMVSTSYIAIIRAHRSANDVRKMYSQVRDFVQFLNEEVRLGSIDYDCYEHLQADSCVVQDVANSLQNGRSPYLALIRKDGLQKTIFYFDKERGKVAVQQFDKVNSNWVPEVGYNEGFRDLFADDVQVMSATFAIFPVVNPYSQLHAYEKTHLQHYHLGSTHSAQHGDTVTGICPKQSQYSGNRK